MKLLSGRIEKNYILSKRIICIKKDERDCLFLQSLFELSFFLKKIKIKAGTSE